MSVYYVNGDLLKSRHNYLCHQVNCQGRMNSGIAKSIRERWPAVYDVYLHEWKNGKSLGENCTVYIHGNIPVQGIINMFAQQNYGYDGKKYTSYDAFWNCLNEIKKFCPKGSSIAFPDHIGCGLGGANWEVIRTMIEEALGETYEVYIYKLEE